MEGFVERKGKEEICNYIIISNMLQERERNQCLKHLINIY